MRGYIALHRDMIDHWVFADPNTLKIWVWCLFKATHKPRSVSMDNGNGIEVVNLKRGQFVFGRFKATEELCLSGSMIYRRMQKMEDDGMLKLETNSRRTIVTICKYDSYQSVFNQSEQPVNNKRTTSEQPVNTYNNNNNNNNNTIGGSNNPPSEDEVFTYANQFATDNKQHKQTCIDIARRFVQYYSESEWHDKNGKKVRNWKQKMLTWYRKDKRLTYGTI